MSETSSQKYLDTMKDIQVKILNFLEDETNVEENYQVLVKLFNDNKIKDNTHDILSLLHLVLKIGNNHYRFPNFFGKIERILMHFKEDIIKYFSSTELFNIFKSNKRILLFFIEQQMIIFDESIAKKILLNDKYINAKYPEYFQPEIKPFLNKKWLQSCNLDVMKRLLVKSLKKKLPENFYEKRKKGENDSLICELIRNDMVKEFIVYINQNNISLDQKINHSIYDTNPFLLKINRYLSMIEYAAFFGSIQIFNYLKLENTMLTPSLCIFAIHGKNAEIIQFLEDNNVGIKRVSYLNYFYEAIKCHHNDIANYFLINFLKNNKESSPDTIIQCLKYYNFTFLQSELINKLFFYQLCKYDYCTLVDFLMKNKVIDINEQAYIRNHFFQRNLKLNI